MLWSAISCCPCLCLWARPLPHDVGRDSGRSCVLERCLLLCLAFVPGPELCPYTQVSISGDFVFCSVVSCCPWLWPLLTFVPRLGSRLRPSLRAGALSLVFHCFCPDTEVTIESDFVLWSVVSCFARLFCLAPTFVPLPRSRLRPFLCSGTSSPVVPRFCPRP